MKHSNLVVVMSLNRGNNIAIYLPSGARKFLGSDEVCVSIRGGIIKIRQSGIDDCKTYKLWRGSFSFNCADANDLIGKYEYSIDGDYLIVDTLTKLI